MLFALIAVLMAYQCVLMALIPPPTQKDWAGIVSRVCVLIACVCIDQLVMSDEDVMVRRTALEIVRSFTGRGSKQAG